uniref:Putative nuclease n=1 Tax=viral metagenome TaxID=1070528 RepID=A0A6M3JPZ1_9ZZZZ
MKENPYDDKYTRPYILKPTVIPDNFVLLQDTREARPLFTRIPKGLTVMSKTLSRGDYSILGQEENFCVERKASDIFSYVVDREKTIKKMKQFKQMEFVGLIIEGKETDLYQYQQFTKIHPESVRGALVSFQVRYGVHLFVGSRENCIRVLLDWAVKFWNIKHEV